MEIERIVVGPLETNCYLVHDGDACWIIDPGSDADRILQRLEALGWTPVAILVTHGHFDHVGAVQPLQRHYDIPFWAHRDEAEVLAYQTPERVLENWGVRIAPIPAPDRWLEDGEVLSLGTTSWRVWHTPGHSPGSICLVGPGVVFTGDLLFHLSVGRTDIRGGDVGRLQASLRRLLSLPPETRVLPGHGPETTLGFEIQHNPFLWGLDASGV